MATYDMTWWTAPDVQRDRDAFYHRAASEAERMRAKNFTEADHINAIRKAKALSAWVAA